MAAMSILVCGIIASNAGFAPDFGRARALASQRLPELFTDNARHDS